MGESVTLMMLCQGYLTLLYFTLLKVGNEKIVLSILGPTYGARNVRLAVPAWKKKHPSYLTLNFPQSTFLLATFSTSAKH